MTIVPDTKDWTWVLERTCPQCGFDTRTVTRQALPRDADRERQDLERIAERER